MPEPGPQFSGSLVAECVETLERGAARRHAAGVERVELVFLSDIDDREQVAADPDVHRLDQVEHGGGRDRGIDGVAALHQDRRGPACAASGWLVVTMPLRAITSERRCGSQPCDRSPETALHHEGAGVAFTGLNRRLGADQRCTRRTSETRQTAALDSNSMPRPRSGVMSAARPRCGPIRADYIVKHTPLPTPLHSSTSLHPRSSTKLVAGARRRDDVEFEGDDLTVRPEMRGTPTRIVPDGL